MKTTNQNKWFLFVLDPEVFYGLISIDSGL